MKRIWLATFLGVILGLGLTFVPQSASPAQPQMFMESNPSNGRLIASTSPSVLPDTQFLPLFLTLGLLLGASVFLIARKRAR